MRVCSASEQCPTKCPLCVRFEGTPVDPFPPHSAVMFVTSAAYSRNRSVLADPSVECPARSAPPRRRVASRGVLDHFSHASSGTLALANSRGAISG